jgi:RNA polymerase sigma-32 factor
MVNVLNRIGPTCFISSSSEIAFSYEQADQETTLAASEEFENRRKALASALAVLNARERRIFEARRLAEEPITLNELADEFGVSRERVRQISVCAFEKVQKAVKHRVAVMETSVPLLAH